MTNPDASTGHPGEAPIPNLVPPPPASPQESPVAPPQLPDAQPIATDSAAAQQTWDIIGPSELASDQPTPPAMVELAPPEPGEEPITGAKPLFGGPGGPKRAVWQREADLLEVAELMNKRAGSAVALARIMNARFAERGLNYRLSAEQMRRDMVEVKKRWAERFMGASVRSRIAYELGLIEAVEREAWLLYERSQRDGNNASQTTRQAQAIGDAGGAAHGGRMGEVTKMVSKAQRDGDAGALALLLKCSERRSALLGLDSVRVEMLESTGPDKEKQAAMAAAYRAKIERDVRRKLAEESVKPLTQEKAA